MGKEEFTLERARNSVTRDIAYFNTKFEGKSYGTMSPADRKQARDEVALIIRRIWDMCGTRGSSSPLAQYGLERVTRETKMFISSFSNKDFRREYSREFSFMKRVSDRVISQRNSK